MMSSEKRSEERPDKSQDRMVRIPPGEGTYSAEEAILRKHNIHSWQILRAYYYDSAGGLCATLIF